MEKNRLCLLDQNLRLKRRKQQQKTLNKTKVPKTTRAWGNRDLSGQFRHLDSHAERVPVTQK